MLDNLIKQKETDNKNLSKEFENWLFRDRGRQIKGIKYFLNKRSESIDKLIIDSAYESNLNTCLLYTSPSPRDQRGSRMPSSA